MQDRAAVQAAGSYAAGSNARCGYSPEGDGELPDHFVCSLRYLGSGGRTERVFFTENADGANVAPLTKTQLTAFVAYERSHIKQLIAAYKRSHSSQVNLSSALNGLALKVSRQLSAGRTIAGQMAAQPRVRGTACDGAYGMSDATPAASLATPGTYLVAGARTSCTVAQVVATAFGDSPTPENAALTVPDRATGKSLTLRCRSLSSAGPVKCVGESATVYLGSDRPPLRRAG